MLKLLRKAETAGKRAHLTEVCPSVLRRADAVGSGDSAWHGGDSASRMSSQLLALCVLLRQQGPRPSADKALEMRRLVVTIGMGACESQRTAFLLLGGDALLLQLLAQVGPEAAEERFHPLINEVVQILAELSISDTALAEAFATHRPLIALLF